MTGTGSYFTATSVEDWTGAAIPAWVFMIVFLALFALFAWFHIELTARVLGVALITEVLALLVLAVGILVAGGGPDGFSAKLLNPTEIFDNPAAISASGRPRRASRCSERSGRGWASRWRPTTPRSPRTRTGSPRSRTARSSASASSTFISYMFVTGWPNGSAMIADQFEGKFGSAFLYPLVDEFVGSALTTVIEVLIITSCFACAMAFYNTSALLLRARPRGPGSRARSGARIPGATRPSWHRWS